MCADPIEAGGEVYCHPCDALLFNWDNMTCPRYGSLASKGRPFNGYCQSNLLPLGDDVYEQNHKQDTHLKTWGVEGIKVSRFILGVQC
jgi:hypothetical protein